MLAAVYVANTAWAAPYPAIEEYGGSTMLRLSGPYTVADRELELSGCAVVAGGFLVVEDELRDGVLYVAGGSGKREGRAAGRIR